jgi:hypothetical protein
MVKLGVAVESAARQLVGRHLSQVRYYTLPYGMTETPAWDFDVAHSADYGLDLVTAEGTTGVTWTQYDDFGYGLVLVDGPIVTELSQAQFSTVERYQPWRAVVGEKITASKVHWFESAIEGRELITAPIALTLRMADSVSIALVCGSWNGPGKAIFPTGDDVVVLWKPETIPKLVPYLDAHLLGP